MASAHELRVSLARLATTSVRIRSVTGRAAGGAKPVFGSWVEHSAQVRRPTKAERTADTETRSVAWVAVLPDATVTASVDAELELPGGEVRPIMTIESVRASEQDEQVALRIMVS